MLTMKRYSLKKLVEIAKHKSPFYKKLYKNVDISNFRLSDLPIIDEDQFWKANSQKRNQILTESTSHGVLLRTGGTSGSPKTSVFSFDEWQTFAKIMSTKLLEANLLRSNDIVANMFLCGALYGGFLFTHETIHESQFLLLELPLGVGQGLNIKDTVSIIDEFKGNVLMGTPHRLISIVSYIKNNKIKSVGITRFLYGGDVLLESQYLFIKSVFPKAIISSSGYGSTDAGFLGYADSSCEINEYRTDNHFTIVEIVDEETGRLIVDENIKGRLIITNLTKVLMPVIRYPVGDLAMWCEPKGGQFRKLKIVGRQTKKDDLLTVGGVEYDYQDFYNLLKKSKSHLKILGFQIVSGNKKITLKIACDEKEGKDVKIIKAEINDLFLRSIPGMGTQMLDVDLIDIAQLKFNARTHKAIKIIKE